MSTDKTRDLLEQILAELYEKQATRNQSSSASYLEAQDEQFLGKIVSNRYDKDSILNTYGPYGSRYSTTSIFNKYSDYGSRYGKYSVNNPYCSIPPKLILNGRLLGLVTVNRYLTNAIATEAFLYTLKNDLEGLLGGRISRSPGEVRKLNRESYIEAGDGVFLGRLNPDRFDDESIFNQFGMYGSRFSPSSIFNQFSTYGNGFSIWSPYNQFSVDPPKLYVKGRFVAFLTKNQMRRPGVDPDELLSWAERNVPRHS